MVIKTYKMHFRNLKFLELIFLDSERKRSFTTSIYAFQPVNLFIFFSFQSFMGKTLQNITTLNRIEFNGRRLHEEYTKKG